MSMWGSGGGGGSPGGGVTVDWTSYTPSYNWTTDTAITGEYRVVDGGETLEVKAKITLTGAPGNGASNLLIGLPNGYTGKTDGVNALPLGVTSCFDADAGSGVQNWVCGLASINGSNQLVPYGPSPSVVGGTAGAGITSTAPFTFASGDSVSMHWRIPLA